MVSIKFDCLADEAVKKLAMLDGSLRSIVVREIGEYRALAAKHCAISLKWQSRANS
jgi:hypothetical protein